MEKIHNVSSTSDSVDSIRLTGHSSVPTEEPDECDAFLERLKERSLQENFPPYMTVDRAISIWNDLKGALWNDLRHDVPTPLIGVNASGIIHFSWNFEGAYLECEVFEAHSETFYEDIDSGDVKSGEFIWLGSSEADWLAKRILRNSLIE